MRITIKSFWPAIIWFILSSIAFCLPGQTLPQNDWFAIIQLDKWIHIGLFTVMVFLWCLPLFHRPGIHLSFTKLFIGISIAFFGYGIVMELIQHFFIPNRAFDFGDIAADAIGCLLGFFFVRWQWKQ
ncbi:MAG: VanZ family protein [Bacteroidia bacterium]|nr:VanZ family protein [Bacteroidia bacterium]